MKAVEPRGAAFKTINHLRQPPRNEAGRTLATYTSRAKDAS